MNIKLINDKSEIDKVIKNDLIYKVISTDISPTKDNFEYNFDNNYFLAGYIDDEIIGILIYHILENGDIYSHIQVLPEYRKEYSFKFSSMCKEWLILNFEGKNMYTHIPLCFKNVILFAFKNGYKEVEITKEYALINKKVENAIFLEMKLIKEEE
jgi:hypothetical protein